MTDDDKVPPPPPERPDVQAVGKPLIHSDDPPEKETHDE